MDVFGSGQSNAYVLISLSVNEKITVKGTEEELVPTKYISCGLSWETTLNQFHVGETIVGWFDITKSADASTSQRQNDHNKVTDEGFITPENSYSRSEDNFC